MPLQSIKKTYDMVQEHVTNFTKELFGYIANGIGDD
ncbi:hypothetical protein ACUOBA_38535, partial [Escherichia coli]